MTPLQIDRYRLPWTSVPAEARVEDADGNTVAFLCPRDDAAPEVAHLVGAFLAAGPDLLGELEQLAAYAAALIGALDRVVPKMPAGDDTFRLVFVRENVRRRVDGIASLVAAARKGGAA